MSTSEPLAHGDDQDLEELTASELVELIELDHALVQQFQSRRAMGAQALLEAVDSHRDARDDDPAHEMASSSDPMAEMQQLLEGLQEVARELELRSRRLSERELNFNITAATLLDAEQRLTVKLEAVLEQISQVRRSGPESPIRAIA